MHFALTTSSRTADFRRPTLGLVNYRAAVIDGAESTPLQPIRVRVSIGDVPRVPVIEEKTRSENARALLQSKNKTGQQKAIVSLDETTQTGFDEEAQEKLSLALSLLLPLSLPSFSPSLALHLLINMRCDHEEEEGGRVALFNLCACG
ncbi:unnamed protein product [Leuciscus chuanchicus]